MKLSSIFVLASLVVLAAADAAGLCADKISRVPECCTVEEGTSVVFSQDLNREWSINNMA